MDKIQNKRFIAYIFDYLIVFVFLGSLLTNPFYRVDNNITEEKDKIINNMYTKADSFSKKIIKEEEYVKSIKKSFNQLNEINVKVKKQNILTDILMISLVVIYYGIIPFFTNGQTIAKKIMKIKVVKNDGEKATLVQYITRTLLIYGVINTLISIIALYIFKDNQNYILVNLGINGVYYLFMLVDLIYLAIKKDKSLHDLISKTKVITE